MDRARKLIGETYYANAMDVIDGARGFRARFDIGRLGSLTVGEMGCGADVRMRFGELGAYHVTVALSGHVTWRQGTAPGTTTSVTRAGVLQPVGDTVIDRWSGDSRVLAVKIDRAALEERLGQLLGRSPRTPVEFASGFDVVQGPGRGWARLLRTVIDELRDAPPALVHQPLVSAPLEEALLNGLLVTVEHPYRAELTAPAQALRPAPVKRAIDAMRERPEHPFTTAELAAEARVGVRWLQEAFRRYVGVSPMAYLRGLRLDRARSDLRAAGPDERGVGDVAHRWGFTHLGRFAAQYRERHGELPSETLRSR
ncbi:AraC family transcriptional regulator [Streptomyces sp. NPDC002004]